MSMEADQARRDARVIARFAKAARGMFEERALVRDGLDVNVTISWHHERGFSFSGSVHDWEQVLAYLGALRRFLLPRDALFVDKVAVIIRRHLPDGEYVTDLDAMVARWGAQAWALPFTLQYTREDGSRANVTAPDLFDLYLFGEVSHLDLAKAEELERVKANMPAEMVQFLILDGAVEATKQVGLLLNMIEYTRNQGIWRDDLVEHPAVVAA